MKQVRAITFDAGGTLLYPHPSVGDIYAEVMGRHGIVAEPAVLEELFHTSLAEALGRPRDSRPGSHNDRLWWRDVVRHTMRYLSPPDDFDALFDDLWNEFAHPRRWRLYDGALDTLAQLRQRGYRLALLSNWDDRLRRLLDGLAIVPYFEHLVISCEVGAEKPDAAIFAAAQRALDLPPEAILHVGDSVHHDLGGAHNAGWHCVIVTHGNGHNGVPHHIGNLAELLDHLPGCGGP